jgi:hypothetical protein
MHFNILNQSSTAEMCLGLAEALGEPEAKFGIAILPESHRSVERLALGGGVKINERDVLVTRPLHERVQERPCRTTPPELCVGRDPLDVCHATIRVGRRGEPLVDGCQRRRNQCLATVRMVDDESRHCAVVETAGQATPSLRLPVAHGRVESDGTEHERLLGERAYRNLERRQTQDLVGVAHQPTIGSTNDA